MLLQQQQRLQSELHTPLRMHGVMPRWALGALGLAFVVLLVGLFAGDQLYQAARRAVSRRDVARAQSLLQEEITAEEGVRLLRDALVRTPDEPLVIRAFAALTEAAGMYRHARFFYEHLSRRGQSTPEDDLRHAAIVARLNDHSGAQIMLRAISKRQGDTAALWRVEAEAATLRGDHAVAREALQKVLSHVPDDRNASLALAKSNAFAPEARRQREGVTRLLDLLDKTRHDLDPTRRNTCLWTLASLTIHDEAQRLRFSTLVADIAWQQIERLVLQRLLEWSVDPTDTQRIRLRADLRQLLAAHANTGLGERLSVARMLQRHGEHALVLDWIGVPLALKDPALCAARLDSLLAGRYWAAAADLIDHEDSPLPHALQSIFRAQVELLSHAHKTKRGDLLLTKALQEARRAGQQSALLTIGRLASEFDRHVIAFTAYGEAMAPHYPLAQFVVEALAHEARLGGGTAVQVLQHLERRASTDAWNMEWQRHITYYRLLCGDQIELAEAHASRLTAAQDPEAAFLAAFAGLRLGKRSAILDARPHLPLTHNWTASQRVALHAIFRAIGDETAARAVAGGTDDISQLHAEERHLWTTTSTLLSAQNRGVAVTIRPP